MAKGEGVQDTMIALRLERSLADALREHARRLGKSQSEAMRDLLAGAVMPARPKQPARAGKHEAVRV